MYYWLKLNVWWQDLWADKPVFAICITIAGLCTLIGVIETW